MYRKITKRGLFTGLLGLTLLFPYTVFGETSVNYSSTTVSYNGKSFSAKWVTVDLTDPYLRVKPVIASGGFGHDEFFTSMMERSSALAGINGAFFSAYEKDASIRYPNGLMIKSGEVMHSGKNQVFEVLADKTANLQNIEIELKANASHNGKTYTFQPWGVNKYYGDNQTDQVVWYTRDWGKSVSYPNSTKVVVRDGIITAITADSVTVPEDGYVCLIGNSNNNLNHLLPNLQVGDLLTLASTVIDVDSGISSPLPRIDAAIGAGPRLLTDSVIDINFARDGFTDHKITTQSNARSFIGTDSSDRLVMGTLSAATITEMSHVLLQIGLTDAMNLDGGASSALFYDGTVKTTPGRLLSNALVVERMTHPQIQLEVNDSFVHEFRGYLLGETSMVPFRGILERIGATFTWNGEEKTLSVQHGSNQLMLKTDQRIAELNHAKLVLPEAPTIVDGHIYLPIRSVIESLGGEVSWDPDLYRAHLRIP
jgi:exopolysaccharide biosynthesis protein